MNRWRLFSISLALVVCTVALVPIRLIAFDWAEEEYNWIRKHVWPDRTDQDEKQATANHATDGFDGAEAEYKEISKRQSNGNGGENLAEPPGRVTKSYIPPLGLRALKSRSKNLGNRSMTQTQLLG
jgi:hypothetical protein